MGQEFDINIFLSLLIVGVATVVATSDWFRNWFTNLWKKHPKEYECLDCRHPIECTKCKYFNKHN